MGNSTRIDVRLANEAWEALMTAHATLMGRYASEDIWSEATVSEYDVLYTLAKGDGPMRISEIQQGVLLSQPALSRAVDRLVTRGLLSRCPDATDGRAVQVALTEDGRRVQREVGRAHAKSVARDVGGALTPDEMRDLQRLCEKLIAQ
ncbi:MarR family transcriptional regulator [Leucobacter coleopterorum]|uniref:MarR family transcriptional regulator n=1 Tax=Leucobacter coleopterorum TaxID=2714933 RepID=A0ABX6K2E2_9MICO|nr:MarR family transcriptional regulator [Leucobacter coleopterorum]QIM19369.1 MarR family transcriptional regulator [Leucobacter coleopterorum]